MRGLRVNTFVIVISSVVAMRAGHSGWGRVLLQVLGAETFDADVDHLRTHAASEREIQRLVLRLTVVVTDRRVQPPTTAGDAHQRHQLVNDLFPVTLRHHVRFLLGKLFSSAVEQENSPHLVDYFSLICEFANEF
jgi:hypothetical protein